MLIWDIPRGSDDEFEDNGTVGSASDCLDALEIPLPDDGGDVVFEAEGCEE